MNPKYNDHMVLIYWKEEDLYISLVSSEILQKSLGGKRFILRSRRGKKRMMSGSDAVNNQHLIPYIKESIKRSNFHTLHVLVFAPNILKPTEYDLSAFLQEFDLWQEILS